MQNYKSDFLNILESRGYIHQCSDAAALDSKLKDGPITAYIGFDCTAPSLHVGSLLPIMMLYWLQQTGSKPIVLMGGGTTRIGDPSGKDSARQILTDEIIETNKAGIRQVFAKFLTFGDGKSDAIMTDNADWLMDINYVDFLRQVGRHFSINRMLTFDSVKLRLEREQPLSFLEFNYMILQAYDFAELSQKLGCTLQMGGSDQWGNIVNGIDLGRRLYNAELFGLTAPLLTTSSGAKMGKTADGAVWLNAEQLTPYDYWQYWRNTEDADVGRFLKLFTTLPLDEIARLEALEGAEINEAKKTLAYEATKLLHGEAAAAKANETARSTFEEGAISENLPSFPVSKSDLEAGLPIIQAITLSGLAASNGEARRHIKGNAIKLNDQRVADDSVKITGDDFNKDGVAKLSFGKKRHILLTL
ncbi:MAG: tyrosine--tRNA ligase [Rhodomicrobium sp.]|nr:MAG: tyrosine--tRNA ligase [Rhodomicrobium sp.]